MVHDALDEELQFRPNLRAKHLHNTSVKRKLEEIFLNKENSYSRVLVERAIQRYYESRRRMWRELTDPAQQERVVKQAKSRRLRSRRQRLYDRRSKALLEGLEKERFSALTVEFMSDESSSDETTVLVHRPDWRSNVMNKFMQELDQRFLDTQKEKKKHTQERKVRISGSLLASYPPPQAPKWTISKDWLKA